MLGMTKLLTSKKAGNEWCIMEQTGAIQCLSLVCPIYLLRLLNTRDFKSWLNIDSVI